MFQKLRNSPIIIYPLFGFGVFIVLIAISWFITDRHIDEQMRINETTHIATDKMHVITKLIDIVRKRTRLSHEMLLSDDIFEKDEIAIEISSLAGVFIQNLEELMSQPLEEEEKAILDYQVTIYPQVIAHIERVKELALQDTNEATEQARTIISRDIVPSQGVITDGFASIMKGIEAKVHDDSTSLLKHNQEYQKVLSFLILTIFIAAIITIFIVIRKILNIEQKLLDLSETLKKEKEAEEQANLSKSRFLAAASHDLRQPLHALTFLFDAVKSADSEATRNTLFPKVELSLNALGGLFNAILDISKLDADAVETHLEHFHILDVLEAVLEDFSHEAKQKGLKLKAHCSDLIIVHSDQVLLERIVRNLISNAIRYTDSGSVLVSCRRRQNHILFQVWDTGIGIDPGSQGEVFEEFHQVDNPQRDRKKGLGLGLSIVKRMCDLLAHPIELRSVKGKGTVVSLLIPAGDASQCIAEAIPEENKPWSIKGLEILLIEDDTEVLEATTILLEKWGCHVTAAVSSADALAKINGDAKNPDLVLSDFRLPDDANGVDAINDINEKLGIQVPAILITGDTQPERISMARNSGYKVLHKPLKPASIRVAIHQLLG
jgi:signal transduction histidine kinase